MALEKDEEFISYCELHSTTPRALFHVDHINRLYKLAGKPLPLQREGFVVMREDVAHPLCEEARKRVRP